MTHLNKLGSLLCLTAALTLGACGSMNTPDRTSSSSSTYPSSSNSSSSYPTYGVVQSIDLVRQDTADSKLGLGTVAGAVVGGHVGSQVGQGRGSTAATVVGAAGGAYIGHKIEERNQNQADVYKITIRMNNGSYQTVTQNTSPDFRVGDQVQIEGGIARRY